jgi:membrane-bound lytic murein transglycosylase B
MAQAGMHRRTILGSISALALLPNLAQAGDFNSFLNGLRARALARGIPQSVIDETTAGLVPNSDVLQLDKHQPEFTLTWAQYSSRVLNAGRVAQGRAKAQSAASLLAAVTSQFGVDAGPLLGIWGIETNYGTTMGDFDVIDALTTLAWDRNSTFFAGQVISAAIHAERLSLHRGFLHRFGTAGYLEFRRRHLGLDGELSGQGRLEIRPAFQRAGIGPRQFQRRGDWPR